MGWGRASRSYWEVEIHPMLGGARAGEQASCSVGHAQSEEQRGSSKREHMTCPVVRFNCSLQQKARGTVPDVTVKLPAKEQEGQAATVENVFVRECSCDPKRLQLCQHHHCRAQRSGSGVAQAPKAGVRGIPLICQAG